MKISTSTFGVIKSYGMASGIKMLANAGFEAIDYSITQNVVNWEEELFRNPSSPAFAAHFKRIAETAKSCGLEIYQCHAPYAPTDVSDPELYAQLHEHTRRAIYAAEYMGCPNIVAHPVMHVDFCYGRNKGKAFQTTLDYFSGLVPALRETGVTMCIENTFFTMERSRMIVSNACSGAEELRDMIDTLNGMHGAHFAACVDTGHALLVKNNPSEMLKKLGNRTRTLHIQDNRGKVDDHLIPSKGIIDWKEVATTLGEVGYKGTFNFEVTSHFTDIRRDTYSQAAFQQACNLLYEIGRSLADIAEGKSFAD